MSHAALQLVNFAVPGLSTVGYSLVNADNTIHTARTTAGVAERGTATGIYGVLLAVPDYFSGEIRWDTGQIPPIYASAGLDDPLAAVAPDDWAVGTVGWIIGHLTGETTTMSGPGTADGILRVTLGQTYAVAQGLAVTDLLTSADPDLTGATVTLEVGAHTGLPLFSADTTVGGTRPAQTLTTELTGAQTAALITQPEAVNFAYWADYGGDPAVRVCLKHGPVLITVAP